MAQLTLSRSTQFTNRFNAYTYYLNNRELCELKYNESRTFNLPEGEYTLCAKYKTLGSPDVTLQLSEQKPLIFETGSNMNIYLFEIPLAVLLFTFLIGSILYFDELKTWVFLGILGTTILQDLLLRKGKGYTYYYSRHKMDYLYIRPLMVT